MNARSGGFSYLGLMLLVAMLSLGASAAGVVWQVAAQRDRERELVFAGLQYRQAIEQYQRRATDPAQRFPQRLEDLLRDPRVPHLVRDLRRLYPDPMTGRSTWGLLKTRDGGVIGVYSQSGRAPMWRFAGPPGMNFATARSHRDWLFVAPSAAGLVKPPDDDGSATAPSRGPLSDPSAVESASPDDTAQAPPPRERPPSQQDYRNRGPEACQRIAAADQAVCAQQGTLFGPPALSDCQDSASARAAVCPFPDAGPLPPLFFRNQ